MSDLLIPQLKWRAYRVFERLSLLTKLSFFLLLMLLLVYMFVYRPQQMVLANLNSMYSANMRNKEAGANNIKNSPAANLAAYNTQFPKLATRATKINALINIAKQQDLLLDEVNYKAESIPNESLSRYQVEFSLFAPYSEIHQFLSTVLSKMPYVALTSLDMHRDNVQDETVEARIQLTFYFDTKR